MSPEKLADDQSKGERATDWFMKKTWNLLFSSFLSVWRILSYIKPTSADQILDRVLLRIEPESLEDAPDPFEREIILPLTITENRIESRILEPPTPHIEIKRHN